MNFLHELLETFPGVLAREELRNLDQIPLSSPPKCSILDTQNLEKRVLKNDYLHCIASRPSHNQVHHPITPFVGGWVWGVSSVE
jgi:hypothetical protein